MTYTTPPTAVAGQPLAASDWNTKVRDSMEFVYSPPGALVYNSAALAINTGTITALTFNSERFDNDGIHSTSSNTGRLTCVTAGRYLISGSVEFASNATGYRQLLLRLNGATYLANEVVPANASIATGVTTQRIYPLVATDYVELLVVQTSGGSLNVTAAGNYSPEFAMTRIG